MLSNIAIFVNLYWTKYMRETKLIGYIRILKVEEMDSDAELKKKFLIKVLV